MLRRMKGKAEWIVEIENELIDDQPCSVVKSSGDNWLVRLWLRQVDGAVLRYEQHLNGKDLGYSELKYGNAIDGVLLPVEIRTTFKLTNQLVVQAYSEYVVAKEEQK